MILYAVQTSVDFGPLMLHRLTINKDKESVLLVSKAALKNIKLSILVENKIFNHIILVNCKVGRIVKKSSELEIIAAVLNEFNSGFSKFRFNVQDFNEIYLMSDYMGLEFPLYLSYQKIPYFLIEALPNFIHQLSANWDKPERRYNRYKDSFSETYANVMFKYPDINKNNKWVTAIILPDSTNSGEFYYNEPLIWNPNELVLTVDSKNIEIIMKLFNKVENIDEKSTMLLAQSSNYAKIYIEFSEYPQLVWSDLKRLNLLSLYADLIAIDFYVTDQKVYFKNHPHRKESKEDLESFNLIEMVKAPMEILIMYFLANEIKLNSALLFVSASNRMVDLFVDEKIELGKNYWRTYHHYNKLYVAMMFIKILGDDIKEIFYPEIMREQISNLEQRLIKTEKKFYKIKFKNNDTVNGNNRSKAFTIMNVTQEHNKDLYDLVMKNVSTKSVVAIFNANEDFSFYKSDMKEFLTPIRIQKVKLKEDTIDPCVDEIVWIYSENAEIIKKARNFETEKILPRLGVKVVVKKQPISYIVNCFKEAEKEIKLRRLEQAKEKLQ